jgi:hypothetical protein
MKKYLSFYLLLLICFFVSRGECFSQAIKISNNAGEKNIVFSNKSMRITVDYNKKANISGLLVNGQEVVKGNAGIYSAIRTKDTIYTTLQLLAAPVVKLNNNTISISGIVYGDKILTIHETWRFQVYTTDIKFSIERTLSKAIMAEQAALPVFLFSNLDTWEGAYQAYGGLAWFYLFNKKLDTYGVYSNSSQFWNSKTGNGLSIDVNAPGKQVAMDYSRTADDKLACTIAVAQKEMLPRFDSGTHRRLFIRDRADVWAPFAMAAGKTACSITLSCFDFKEKFGRGNLTGINGEQVNGC